MTYGCRPGEQNEFLSDSDMEELFGEVPEPTPVPAGQCQAGCGEYIEDGNGQYCSDYYNALQRGEG